MLVAVAGLVAGSAGCSGWSSNWQCWLWWLAVPVVVTGSAGCGDRQCRSWWPATLVVVSGRAGGRDGWQCRS